MLSSDIFDRFYYYALFWIEQTDSEVIDQTDTEQSLPIYYMREYCYEHAQKNLQQCPYEIDYIYSDNGKEYKGNVSHAFVQACCQNNIGQKFTRIARPQTNGKAERVIRTLMQMWHEKIEFTDSFHRQIELNRFINFYNTVKPHKSLNNQTPYEILNYCFNQQNCK